MIAKPRLRLALVLPAVAFLVSLAVLLPRASVSSALGFITPADYWSPMDGATGIDLHGVWGSSDNSVFAVGSKVSNGQSHGVILHYDGVSWSAMSGVTADVLEGIWGSSDNDVFAVGTRLLDDQWCGVILHYDGSSWSTMSGDNPDELVAIWGSSAANVLAVGQNGTILRYDASSWTAMSSGSASFLYGIWGSSDNSIFAVGASAHSAPETSGSPGPAILHYDGSSWTAMSSGTAGILDSIWGTSDNNVFAVGASGTILHYDGSTWSAVTTRIAPDLYAVWGSSDNNVLAVGDSATVLRYDGSTWGRLSGISTTRISSGIIRSTYPLCGVWGSSDNDAFAVGSETILRHPARGEAPDFPDSTAGFRWDWVYRIIAGIALVAIVLWLIVHSWRRRTDT